MPRYTVHPTVPTSTYSHTYRFLFLLLHWSTKHKLLKHYWDFDKCSPIYWEFMVYKGIWRHAGAMHSSIVLGWMEEILPHFASSLYAVSLFTMNLVWDFQLQHIKKQSLTCLLVILPLAFAGTTQRVPLRVLQGRVLNMLWTNNGEIVFSDLVGLISFLSHLLPC